MALTAGDPIRGKEPPTYSMLRERFPCRNQRARQLESTIQSMHDIRRVLFRTGGGPVTVARNDLGRRMEARTEASVDHLA